jgi:predicted RNA binding protein YcfA (HicA-like mRNA interferase family)
MRHPDGRSTVVPVHSGEVLGPGIISKILQDTEIDREEFRRLLQE